MKFTPIDRENWPRNQMFYYFSVMANTGYSINVSVDVTHLLGILKQNHIKFFPTYLWLVTKNLNKQIEFKTAILDEQLGYYDYLTPLYASFHEDDKTFSFMWTEYDDHFLAFYNHYLESQKEFSNNHGVLCQPKTPPPNAYTVSCIPWVSFQSFTIHSFDSKPYFFPSVEAGKFYEQNGKTMIMLSLSCHHATTDGYHIQMFLNDLQKDMDSFSIEM